MFTNNLGVFSFRPFTKILVGDQLQQRSFEAFYLVIPEPEHQDHIQHSLESSSVDHSLDRVGLKMEFVKKISLPSLDCVLDPCVKIRQCDMLKFTTHTRFMIFGLTDIGFHEQLDQNKFKYFKCILDVFYIHACFIF